VVGDHHGDATLGQRPGITRQLGMVSPRKARRRVLREVRRSRQRHVRRIAVHHISGLDSLQQIPKVHAHERRLLRLLGEVPHFLFREVHRFSVAERHIKVSVPSVPTQAMETVAIEVDEQDGLAPWIRCAVELIAQFVVPLGSVVLGHEQLTAGLNERFAVRLEHLVREDQVAVDVAEQVFWVVGVEEHRAGADERFDEAVAGWEKFAQERDKPRLAAKPLQIGTQDGHKVHLHPSGGWRASVEGLKEVCHMSLEQLDFDPDEELLGPTIPNRRRDVRTVAGAWRGNEEARRELQDDLEREW